MTEYAPQAEPATPATKSDGVDAAFDAWFKTLHVEPSGKAGLRKSFRQGYNAARGEQPAEEYRSLPPYPKAKRCGFQYHSRAQGYYPCDRLRSEHHADISHDFVEAV